MRGEAKPDLEPNIRTGVIKTNGANIRVPIHSSRVTHQPNHMCLNELCLVFKGKKKTLCLGIRYYLGGCFSFVDISAGQHRRCCDHADGEALSFWKCRGKTRKYNKAMHQLNGRRDSAITLSTRLDFDLCLRMGRFAIRQFLFYIDEILFYANLSKQGKALRSGQPSRYSVPKTKFTCGCLTKSPYLQNGWAQYTPTVSVRNFGSSAEEDKPNTKPSLYQRFKAMYRDYWYVLVPVHLVTSAAWFGGFYYLASSGFDIVSLLEYLHVSEKVINPLRNGHATTGYLAISYALYKIATPVRYTVTLGGTTVSINYLKKWGYIKPVPSKERLKELFEDQKEMIKEKGQTMKDNMLQTFKPTENN
ncbi:hypothetical protein J6590_102622 [Homalodisca vitripennis]|nr:hypothetical protein J6590_102622 [Homalodisca vitripennis]